MKSVKLFDEVFAEKLKRLRKARGMTLQQLSDATGISPSYISRMERGEKQSPSFPILTALASALNVDVLTLAEGLVGKDEVVILDAIMFRAQLRVAGKILTEEETMQVLNIIELIFGFEWSKSSQWNEIAKLGNAINKLKNAK